jgi:hypothetical protein
MRISLPIAAAMGACLALSAGMANAKQSAEEMACTRAEVKADCMAFMKTHVWNEGASAYVLKSDPTKTAEPPAGVPTRAQIRAQRDKFLASHKWDEGKSAWISLGNKTRDVGGGDLACDKTRAEVAADCQQFLKTHRWDEARTMYVPIKK